MKREQIKKLLGEGATDETIDAIMKLHGDGVEAIKTQVTDLTKQLETAGTQLTEANAQIEKFKGMKPEELEKAATEWKTKFETAQKESAAALAQVKFDHALEGALTGAKAKNPKAVKALLEMQNLKLNETDGSIIGLEDQLKAVKEKNDYLFDSDEPAPRFGGGGGNQPVITDSFEAALWKGAGIKPPEQKG